MFLRLASREPDAHEQSILNSLFAEQLEYFEADKEAANSLLQVGESKTPDETDSIQLAALTVVGQAILSSDAAVWKR